MLNIKFYFETFTSIAIHHRQSYSSVSIIFNFILENHKRNVFFSHSWSQKLLSYSFGPI